MIKLIPIITLAFISCITVPKQDNEQNILECYKKAIINKDTALFNSFADSKFRIGVYEGKIAKYFINHALTYSGLPDSLYFGKVYNTGEYKKQEVHYCYPQGKKDISSITFSKDGKILFSDLFDNMFNFTRFKESVKVAEIPFVYENESIIIKAKLNGSKKIFNMLFDTGADGMALAAALKDEANVKIAQKRETNMPGGQMSVDYSTGNSVNMGSLTLHEQNMVLFPRMREGCDGIIGGANLFRAYITEIDFDKSKIILYSLGQFNPENKYSKQKLRYENGLPTVGLQIFADNQCFKSDFIMDTGAGYEVIMFGTGTKKQNKALLDKHLPTLYYSYNYSVGHRSRITISKTDSICFAGLNFPAANIAIEPFDINKHARQNVNGSIGVKLLHRFNWIVDLVSYKLYTKSNKYSSFPVDFTIGGFLLGYEGEKLFVKFPLNSGDTKSKILLPKDEIIEINGIDVKLLTQEKLNKIKSKSKVTLKLIREGQNKSISIEP